MLSDVFRHIYLYLSNYGQKGGQHGQQPFSGVRFKKTKVDRTLEQCTEGPIITVDLDKSGDVVGVEAILWDEFQIANILKIARVKADAIDFSRAKFRAPIRHARELDAVLA